VTAAAKSRSPNEPAGSPDRIAGIEVVQTIPRRKRRSTISFYLPEDLIEDLQKLERGSRSKFVERAISKQIAETKAIAWNMSRSVSD